MACITCLLAKSPVNCEAGCNHGTCNSCLEYCQSKNNGKPKLPRGRFYDDDLRSKVTMPQTDNSKAFHDTIGFFSSTHGPDVILGPDQLPYDGREQAPNMDGFVYRYLCPKLRAKSPSQLIQWVLLIWGYSLLLCQRKEAMKMVKRAPINDSKECANEGSNNISTDGSKKAKPRQTKILLPRDEISVMLASLVARHALLRLDQLLQLVFTSIEQGISQPTEVLTSLSLLRLIFTIIYHEMNDDRKQPICAEMPEQKSEKRSRKRVRDSFTTALVSQFAKYCDYIKQTLLERKLFCRPDWRDNLEGDVVKAIHDLRSGRIKIFIRRQEKPLGNDLKRSAQQSQDFLESIETPISSPSDSLSEGTSEGGDTTEGDTHRFQDEPHMSMGNGSLGSYRAVDSRQSMGNMHPQPFRIRQDIDPLPSSVRDGSSAVEALGEYNNSNAIWTAGSADFDNLRGHSLDDNHLRSDPSGQKFQCNNHHSPQPVHFETVAELGYDQPMMNFPTDGTNMQNAFPRSFVCGSNYPNHLYIGYEGNNSLPTPMYTNIQHWDNPGYQMGGFGGQSMRATCNLRGFTGPSGTVGYAFSSGGGGCGIGTGGFASMGAGFHGNGFGNFGHLGVASQFQPDGFGSGGWNSVPGLPYLGIPATTRFNLGYRGFDQGMNQPHHDSGLSLQNDATGASVVVENTFVPQDEEGLGFMDWELSAL